MPRPKQASAADIQMMLDALNGGGQCKAVAVYCPTFHQPETNPLSIGVMNLENFFVHRKVCRACVKFSTSIAELTAASRHVEELLTKGISDNGNQN